MRNLTLVLLFFCCVLSPAVAGVDEHLESLEIANRRLRAEYELATKSQIYFVFALTEKKIQFKASGLAIAELPVAAVRYWGQVATDKVRTVASKHSLAAPERDVVQIPSPEEAAKIETKPKKEEKKFELSALELSDMPNSFQLRFDDGLIVSVRPAPEGFFHRLWRALGQGFWYVSRPLLSVWSALHKEKYAEIQLTIPPNEARLLYWSLNEGASCLLID